MNNKFKLIWDFRGPEAKHIAEHHVKHLKEFAKALNLENSSCFTEERTSMMCTAIMQIEEKDVNEVQAALKPHRIQETNQ